MKSLSVIFAVAVAVAAMQTQIVPSQTKPMTAPLVNGLGTTIQDNADGSGQLNVTRLVRTLMAKDAVRTADCHGMIISAGYALALPIPSSVPGFPNGCEVMIKSNGAAVPLSGGYTGAVPANGFCLLDSDGSVWQPEIC